MHVRPRAHGPRPSSTPPRRRWRGARGVARDAERARSRRRAARGGARRSRAGGRQPVPSQPRRGRRGGAGALEAGLAVEPGYELALAATLGARLGAALVADRGAAERLLAQWGEEGGSALVVSAPASQRGRRRRRRRPSPARGRCSACCGGDPGVLAVAARLLADTWVVEHLDELPGDFRGIAVTPAGRVWDGAAGELRQAPSGGLECALEQRNRREALIADSERAAQAEHAARASATAAQQLVAEALDRREAADAGLRARRPRARRRRRGRAVAPHG